MNNFLKISEEAYEEFRGWALSRNGYLPDEAVEVPPSSLPCPGSLKIF